MGQCLSRLRRRDAAVDAPVSEQQQPEHDLHGHMNERTPRDAGDTARIRNVRPRRMRQWHPVAGRLSEAIDVLHLQIPAPVSRQPPTLPETWLEARAPLRVPFSRQSWVDDL